MKLYLFAVSLTVASTLVLINACIFHSSVNRGVPINFTLFK